MKTLSCTVISSKPISISKAKKVLSTFISSENNGASQATNAYLRRTFESIKELSGLHRDLISAPPAHNHNKLLSEIIPSPIKEKRLLEDHQNHGSAHHSVEEGDSVKRKRKEREVNIGGVAPDAGIDMFEATEAVDRGAYGVKEYKKLKKKKILGDGDEFENAVILGKEANRKMKKSEVETGKKDRKKRKASGEFQHE